MRTLDDLAPTAEGVLKLKQRVMGFRTLIHMKRELRRYAYLSALLQQHNLN